MRPYAVFGNPIAHSKSPLLHNAVFRRYEKELGFKGEYRALLLEKPGMLKQRFLELGLYGANITTPFKEEAFALSDKVEGLAQEIKAVNTWVLREGQIVGYNTDIEGFLAPLKGLELARALVFGAGGSARAVVCALKSMGTHVSVCNRSGAKLAYFQAQNLPCFLTQDCPLAPYDLIINTTTAGLKDKNLPCEESLLKALFKKAQYAYDLIYQQTPFLSLAKKHNLPTFDGKAMLIAQAVLSFAQFAPHLQSSLVLKTMQEAFA
ncbi:Shikimate 5-dehydrogenase I alpha [Helicobacter heilmannii]|uniref:shikimate dehydrogenase n=1 Tax=Helicobacter heilmannii TaxID=35817 RepID=UPI0006A1CAA2|nr:shikimate dehydrogenase [Helicobacter heilmannii]GMB93952.1 Shikimate 5-dehydrogenase [Helicobacter heilmannii]CRF51091.1 Shikimate 5-dehydrogenase I alpha [Helicobacter heilmannii]